MNLIAALLLFLGVNLAHAQDIKPTAEQTREAAGIRAEAPGELTAADLANLAPEIRAELARRYAAKKDILNWGRVLFPEKFYLPFCQDLHGYFVKIRADPFTNTEAPRGHAKTTIKCFLIPIFQALEEPASFRHYLNVQSAKEKAIDINRAIKLELEENEALRLLYGDQVSSEKWTDKQIVLANGVVFTAIGAGQSMRGINYRNIRPDYVIVDDLYDEDEINNHEATQKRNDWFWGALYKALAKGRRSSLHFQGTAINGTDLLAELTETAKTDNGIKSRTFRAITHWGRKRVLWRELNTFDSLVRDQKRMGTVIFMREMQNERRDDATAIVKKVYLYPDGEGTRGWEYEDEELRFDGDVVRFRGVECRLVDVVLACDPSIGEKLTSDFTGVVVVYKVQPAGAPEDGCIYLLDDARNEHLSLDRRILLLNSLKDKYRTAGRPVSRANIEAIAGFKDFIAQARSRTGLPIHEVDRVPDKITHLENKSHYFENFRVFVSRRIPKETRSDLVHQLTTNKPKHDDLRDALLHALDGRPRQRWGPA